MTTGGAIEAATLSRLAHGLRASGYTAAVEGEALTVKLPMFSSVTVEAGSPGTKPYAKFGMVRRGTATLMTIASVAIGAWVASDLSIPSAVWFTLLAGALAWDAARWVITQRTLNRVERLLSAAPREG